MKPSITYGTLAITVDLVFIFVIFTSHPTLIIHDDPERTVIFGNN